MVRAAMDQIDKDTATRLRIAMSMTSVDRDLSIRNHCCHSETHVIRHMLLELQKIKHCVISELNLRDHK